MTYKPLTQEQQNRFDEICINFVLFYPISPRTVRKAANKILTIVRSRKRQHKAFQIRRFLGSKAGTIFCNEAFQYWSNGGPRNGGRTLIYLLFDEILNFRRDLL